MSAPVSATAKGQLRLLSAKLEAEAARITKALDRVPPKVLNPAYWKGRVGTERAVEKIIRAVPVPPELRTRHKAVWRFLQPVEALPAVDAEDARPGFVVMTIIAGTRNRLVRAETFGAGFTCHAVGRLLDRSAFRVDPAAAMLEAHAALTELPEAEGERVFDLADAQMPAAGGAFLATPGRFGVDASPLLIARTWLSADQLHDDQAATLGAWRTLLTHPVPPP